jgi:hypothetical protein
MIDDWDEREDAVAAGSICPVPDCGALVVSYRPQNTQDATMPGRGVISHVCTVVSTLASLKMS